jgi:sulfhydrogenase subunit beta (sulfur reductase)
MDKILTKKALAQWGKKLRDSRVFFPRPSEDGRWDYAEASEGDELILDVRQTAVPPKKILFPQREVFAEFSETVEGTAKTLEVKETLPDDERVVIFGVRPCEGRAAWLLDEVFGGEFTDPYYWKRRNQTTLVGLACGTPPSENCFCTSVEGSPYSEEGLDILLTDLGDRYFVRALTDKGEKLVAAAGDMFQNPKPEDKKKVKAVHGESAGKIQRHLKDAREISEKLKGQFDSPLWDDEAMSCLRCGVCTYLCPSCHCFDINDEIESASPLRGKRVRTWDTCQFPDFTMHSSGHNPRPDKAARLRQRLYHKFRYFVEVYDKFMCVGCGRCITLCPVGIDIISVLDKAKTHGS